MEACSSLDKILLSGESAQLSEGASQLQRELQMLTLLKSLKTVIPIRANGSSHLLAYLYRHRHAKPWGRA